MFLCFLIVGFALNAGFAGEAISSTNNTNRSSYYYNILKDGDLYVGKSSQIGVSLIDRSGYSISGVGDVNNDSYDDFLIGVPYNDARGVDAGKAFLFLGNDSGWSRDYSLSEAAASLAGENAGDNAGYSVAGAGDVNNDGYDDILIGAHFFDASSDDDDTGKAYLIFGKESGWAMNTLLSDADASFIGESEEDEFGHCVTGIGDINNDTFDDFAISALYSSEGGLFAGKTYIYFGNTTDKWSKNMASVSVELTFIGESDWDESGISVAGAGDVNDDGYDDFLIGAHISNDGGSKSGKSYLILGNTRENFGFLTNLSKANASYIGEAAYDQSGWSVAGAGDVNDDGYDDFLISAHLNDQAGVEAGKSYLIFGNSTTNLKLNTNLSHANASFIGEAAGDYAGLQVAGAGDVNNDSYDDFLIGTPWNDEGGNNIGQTYLILGRASNWEKNISLINANASFNGEESVDYSGWAVAAAGDINNDTYDDILIGAILNDQGGTDAGKTYLILGHENDWAMDSSLSTANASFIMYNKQPLIPFFPPSEEPIMIPAYPPLILIPFSLGLIILITLFLCEKTEIIHSLK